MILPVGYDKKDSQTTNKKIKKIQNCLYTFFKRSLKCEFLEKM